MKTNSTDKTDNKTFVKVIFLIILTLAVPPVGIILLFWMIYGSETL